MNVLLSKSLVRGKIIAPSSKSMTHRALILGALAKGQTTIKAPLESEDTFATSKVLGQLGVPQTKKKEWTIQGNQLEAPKEELYCNESGTTLRFMTAVSAIVDGECRLTGGPSLRRRPVNPLVEALQSLGVEVKSTKGHPPVTVYGKGKIPGGDKLAW